jgi:hypothetical protein
MFNFISYISQFATTLKDFAPYTNNFYRASSVAKIEELLQNMRAAADNLLLIAATNHDGVIGDNNSDNFIDNPSYQFYILKHVKQNTQTDIDTTLTTCKNAGRKILAKMLHDRRNNLNNLSFLSLSRVPYYSVGPIGNNYHGIIFDFSVVQNADLVYKTSDYITPDE